MLYQKFEKSGSNHKAVKFPRRIFNADGPSALAIGLYRKPATTLFNMDMVNANIRNVAKDIVEAANRSERATISFINAHCVNIAQRDPEYRATLDKTEILLPDGSGITLAAKLAGEAVPQNLNGTDLFPLICEEAAQHNKSIYLLGGKPGIAALTARNMQVSYPDLEIAGTCNGYFNAEEEADVIAAINNSGASILLVGFGVPLQEKWISKNRSKLNIPIVAAVGGLFDYYSNQIPRAPQWMRNMGCEWIWRFMQEPRRLAGRYIAGNAEFILHALRYGYAARGYDLAVSNVIKRALDIAISATALFVLSPLILLMILTISLEDKGSPFFKQIRIGKNGRTFKMWKFRSMYKDAEQRLASLTAQSDRDSVCFKMKDDPRVTGVGKILRKSSLDELPQLFNVLKGDMSIVGPRPALPSEVLQYPRKARKRLKGKPGITCIWQVSGRANIPFEQQVEMDIDYLSRISIWRDIALMFKTIPAVLTARGAY